MDAVILAAGKSSRFGGNKLLQTFVGKTLLEYAFLFCLTNDIENVYITISDDEVLDKANYKIYKQIFKTTGIAYQNPEKYGPAAAIMPWADVVRNDFIVLLADNFTWGSIKGVSDMLQTIPNSSVVGSIYKPEDNDNLRLAFIEEETNQVIEKPHTYNEGRFFGGFCAFSNDTLENLKNLKPSKERGEYEITHLINSNPNIYTFDLEQISWKDLTYAHEITELENYIKYSISK